MVTPPATSSRMICHMVRRLRGSRPVVGSSRKMIRGSPTRRHRPGRAGAACRRSRSPAGLRAASAEVERAPAARPPAARPSARPRWRRSAHEEQVLLAGEQLVHRRELAGDPDPAAHRVGVARPGRGRRHRAVAAVGADQGGQDAAPWWSCRRRWGRAGRRSSPSGISRSMPSSTTLSPNDLRSPVADTAVWVAWVVVAFMPKSSDPAPGSRSSPVAISVGHGPAGVGDRSAAASTSPSRKELRCRPLARPLLAVLKVDEPRPRTGSGGTSGYPADATWYSGSDTKVARSTVGRRSSSWRSASTTQHRLASATGKKHPIRGGPSR